MSIKKYCDTYSKVEDRIKRALLNYPPNLVDGHIVEVKVNNKIQEGYIESIKYGFTSFLCQDLQNSKIDIRVTATQKEDVSKKIMSHEEKINLLIEKNPNIKTLIDRFNLRGDY